MIEKFCEIVDENIKEGFIPTNCIVRADCYPAPYNSIMPIGITTKNGANSYSVDVISHKTEYVKGKNQHTYKVKIDGKVALMRLADEQRWYFKELKEEEK